MADLDARIFNLEQLTQRLAAELATLRSKIPARPNQWMTHGPAPCPLCEATARNVDEANALYARERDRANAVERDLEAAREALAIQVASNGKLKAQLEDSTTETNITLVLDSGESHRGYTAIPAIAGCGPFYSANNRAKEIATAVASACKEYKADIVNLQKRLLEAERKYDTTIARHQTPKPQDDPTLVDVTGTEIKASAYYSSWAAGPFYSPANVAVQINTAIVRTTERLVATENKLAAAQIALGDIARRAANTK